MIPRTEEVSVREIDGLNRRDVDQFIELPFRLYRNVPQWTPPLRFEIRNRLNPRKHTYFEHSAAGFFLAEKDGQVVGRIAVLRQRFYNEAHQNDTAFFYWFESTDDQSVAEALFNAGKVWGQQRGLRQLLGPVGFIQPDPPGILVQGFEHEGTGDVPWHFPYYEDLLLRAGFESHTDYLSGYIDRSIPFPDAAVAQGQEALITGGYQMQVLANRRTLRNWAPQFFSTYLTAFEAVPDFYGMSGRDFTALFERMRFIIDLKTTQGLLKGDELRGFILSFRDVTPALKKARGGLLPFLWWHLLSRFSRPQQCNIIALGVLPEHQKGGVNLALLSELLISLRDTGYARAEIVQIVKGNANTHGDMTRLGAKWDKCHRVYRREISPDPAS